MDERYPGREESPLDQLADEAAEAEEAALLQLFKILESAPRTALGRRFRDLGSRSELTTEEQQELSELEATLFSSDPRQKAEPKDGKPATVPIDMLTDGQRRLWLALDGRILTAEALASEAMLNTSAPTVRGWVEAVRKAGHEIGLRRGRGYFRPDAPPGA